MVAIPEKNSPTRDAIYAAYEAQRGDGFRAHLGASIIGKACMRALWYDFHWTTPAQYAGRILRLFETGQREEERLVRNLRDTGATVLEVDPETGRQFSVEAYGGHFGGSLDAVAIGILEAPKTWHVVEFKTHGVKSFRDLCAKGVEASKPQHTAQMQVYMHLTDITRAIYIAVCKDTDALYVERIYADADAGQRLLTKARRVIYAPKPLSRISEDPAWFECRFCDHHDLCHGDALAARNCRSCLHAAPVEGGWHCARHDCGLSVADQRAACPDHLFISDLVTDEVPSC
ncbi:MAG: oxidoreductase [Alphaproteobacteria bacterium]|nr:oxidoreductase [Alphaproteobacteria bacterium]